MYYVYPEKSYKKKIRGQNRKFSSMEKNFEKLTSTFPEPDYYYGYWHLHLPTSQSFIDSCKTPVSLRRKCIQLIIDRVQYLMNIKPQTDIPIRVVASINLPDIWDSQIIVFYGDDYYKKFFNRNHEYQKWIPLQEKRNILREWQLNNQSLIEVRGYREELYDDEDDTCSIKELWFIGELD